MALLLNNNYEGGTNGTTIAPGNSGGGSGDAFNAVTAGGGQVFNNTNQAHGTGLNAKVTTAATVAASYDEWNTALGTLTTNQRLGGRMYLVVPGNPASATLLVHIRTATGALVQIVQQTGGTIGIRGSAGAVIGTVSTLALTAGTLYRLEWDLLGVGTTSGNGSVNIYLGDSTTPSDSACRTGAGAGFGTAAPTVARFGITTAAGKASSLYYFDAIQLNDTGMPGPESTTTPVDLGSPAAASNSSASAAITAADLLVPSSSSVSAAVAALTASPQLAAAAAGNSAASALVTVPGAVDLGSPSAASVSAAAATLLGPGALKPAAASNSAAAAAMTTALQLTPVAASSSSAAAVVTTPAVLQQILRTLRGWGL